MKPQAKTIQIFLPDGDPRGLRVAELTTRIVQAIDVPRSLLPSFFEMPESNQVAVYLLIGAAEDESDMRLYVGQTGDLKKRLASHNKEKDFWQRALVLVSKTNSLTQTHALNLEWLCIQEAKKANRYGLENSTDGSKPHTPAPLEADCYEIFETGRTLIATLGYPAFEPVAKPVSESDDRELFYCNRAGTHGVGEYTEEGFVVLKGSVGRAQATDSFSVHNYSKHRDALIRQGKIVPEGTMLVFHEDVLFNSPSAAAAILCGAAANGWKEWKSHDGITLEMLKRDVV